MCVCEHARMCVSVMSVCVRGLLCPRVFICACLCLHMSTCACVYIHVCVLLCVRMHASMCVCAESRAKTPPLLQLVSGPPGPLLGPQVTADLRTWHLGWGGGGAVRTLLRAGMMAPPDWNPALLCLGGCGLSRAAPKSQSPAGSWDTVRACLPGRGQGSVTSVCQAHLPLSPGWRPQHFCLHSP